MISTSLKIRVLAARYQFLRRLGRFFKGASLKAERRANWFFLRAARAEEALKAAEYQADEHQIELCRATEEALSAAEYKAGSHE